MVLSQRDIINFSRDKKIEGHAFELGSEIKGIICNNPGFSETQGIQHALLQCGCLAENTGKHLHLNKA